MKNLIYIIFFTISFCLNAKTMQVKLTYYNITNEVKSICENIINNDKNISCLVISFYEKNNHLRMSIIDYSEFSHTTDVVRLLPYLKGYSILNNVIIFINTRNYNKYITKTKITKIFNYTTNLIPLVDGYRRWIYEQIDNDFKLIFFEGDW